MMIAKRMNNVIQVLLRAGILLLALFLSEGVAAESNGVPSSFAKYQVQFHHKSPPPILEASVQAEAVTSSFDNLDRRGILPAPRSDESRSGYSVRFGASVTADLAYAERKAAPPSPVKIGPSPIVVETPVPTPASDLNEFRSLIRRETERKKGRAALSSSQTVTSQPVAPAAPSAPKPRLSSRRSMNPDLENEIDREFGELNRLFGREDGRVVRSELESAMPSLTGSKSAGSRRR